MKIIHTADWHLGNKMHEINRLSEAASFLDWLKSCIESQGAEALIVAGDIFDTVNPPVEARRLYCRFLASLAGTCCKNVVITGGNHDSGALLDSEKEILAALNVHVVGSASDLRTEDFVFELFDAEGKAFAVCAAVPFMREIELRDYFDSPVEPGKFSDSAYGALYSKVCAAAEKIRAGRKIPLIATGHLYAADLEGRQIGLADEKKADDGTKLIDVVGNLGSVHAGVFPENFDYVALGHIHYCSMVAKNPSIRYSGSPFVLGFDEAKIPRCVLAVDFSDENPGEKSVEKIPVPSFFEFKRICGNSASIKKELEKIIKNPPEKNTYIELYYVHESSLDIREELEDCLSKLPENTAVVSWKVQDSKAIMTSDFYDMDMDELKSFSEEEIFKSLIISKLKIPEGAGEEESEKIKNDTLEKFLPLFKQLSAELSK